MLTYALKKTGHEEDRWAAMAHNEVHCSLQRGLQTEGEGDGVGHTEDTKIVHLIIRNFPRGPGDGTQGSALTAGHSPTLTCYVWDKASHSSGLDLTPILLHSAKSHLL